MYIGRTVWLQYLVHCSSIYTHLLTGIVADTSEQMKDMIPLQGGSERVIGAGILASHASFITLAHGVVGITTAEAQYVLTAVGGHIFNEVC